MSNKVHLLEPGSRGFKTWCGRRSLGLSVVDPLDALDSRSGHDQWEWLPRSAQCGTCARTIPYEQRSYVTPEIELAIETALHQLAVHMQTWPDTWNVDPHGTGSNPHLWHQRAFGRPTCRVCGEHKYNAKLLLPRESLWDLILEAMKP